MEPMIVEIDGISDLYPNKRNIDAMKKFDWISTM
jgi:hypothetical protein